MMGRPDLIVPIRDRRAHKRILTLKNARYAALAVIIFLAGLTINWNLGRKPAGQYGRLYDNRLPATPATMPPQEMPVVQEAPPATSAPDPVLAAPSVGGGQAFMPVPASNAPQTGQARVPVLAETNGASGDVAVVNDDTGVHVVRSTADAPRPLLQGGIFKQSQ